MKQKFSVKWRKSKQKRKKRKYRARAPLHIRHKLMSSNLSKVLREKYERRSFPLRKNDTVKVMRGKFKGKQGKISKVDLMKLRVSIEGLQTQKKDGTKVNVFFRPSNLQIQELVLEDKKRVSALERKKEKKARREEKRKSAKKIVKERKKEKSKEGKNALEKK